MKSSNKYNPAIHGKWVPGYENKYSATQEGKVWSFMRSEPHQMTGAGKYEFVYFYNSDSSKRVRMQIHRAVLMAFKGVPAEGYQGMHLDGNIKNNRLDNLAWGSSKENQSHRMIHGTRSVGSSHGKAKIDESTAQLIWNECLIKPRSQVAAELNVSKDIIQHICSGHTWPSVNRHGTLPKFKTKGNCRLSLAKAEEIRQLRSDGMSARQLAEKYQVGKTTVLAILRNQSWIGKYA